MQVGRARTHPRSIESLSELKRQGQSALTWPFPSGLLLYLGLRCSALAFARRAHGLRHLTTAHNAVVALELPVGLGAAALLLSEILGLTQLTGGAFLLIGAVVSVHRGNPA